MVEIVVGERLKERGRDEDIGAYWDILSDTQ